MTFREDGDLDTSGVSGGGGGRGGRGLAVGGGLGGVAVVIVALLLGVDPSQLGLGDDPGTSTGTGAGGQSSAAADMDAHVHSCTLQKANSDTVCRIVATTESLEDVWGAQFPAQTGGRRYTQPHTDVFTGSVRTRCGTASAEVGPFYCPADQLVYIDPDFFDDVLVRRLGGSDSPAAEEYVVAHEFGHHVQDLLGDIDRAQQDPEGRSSGAVRVELQADCYAGLWAHFATVTPAPGGTAPLLRSLSDGDVDDIVRTAVAIGDDHIQKVGGGRVDPGSWTHGSSEMRQQWFLTGYREGSLSACDTFSAQL